MGSKAAKETPEERATRITAEEQIERKKEIILGAIILGIILFVFISSIFFLKYYYPILETRAFFGDSNGTVNTLFSALAFGGIIYTILLQRKELKLQREELRETKEEMRRSAQAQEDSNTFLTEQLRLNVMPVFEFVKSLRSSNNGNKFCSMYLKNRSNDAFDIMIKITSRGSEKKSYISNYEILNKNEYIDQLIPIIENSILDFEITYTDVQSNKYMYQFHVYYDIELHPIPINTIPAQLENETYFKIRDENFEIIKAYGKAESLIQTSKKRLKIT
ncbi:hypothetical protein [Nonlabens dokdonensis]|uniref:hypothetical protein n=1 Tax=Nonlabens dokdonensis TaxID=328515 RepID=UPI0026ED87A6|nr:hypothetical protein [Nonlabens dokdonensis]